MSKYAGDTIQAAVRAYYKEETEPEKRMSIPAEQMLAGLLQTLVAPGTSGGGLHEGASGVGSLGGNPGLTAGDFRGLRSREANEDLLTKPKAYLNLPMLPLRQAGYVFCDKQLNFVKESSGVRQVEQEGELETLSSGAVVVRKTGYVYVFTSNESEQETFFDNLAVTLF